jgi:hypothetical protein
MATGKVYLLIEVPQVGLSLSAHRTKRGSTERAGLAGGIVRVERPDREQIEGWAFEKKGLFFWGMSGVFYQWYETVMMD